MYFLYSIIYSLALLVLFIPQYLKRPKAVRSRWLRNKFGIFDLPEGPSGIAPVWIHAVSVGEVNAALPFVRKLRTVHPSVPVIFSTMTDTGQKVAKEKAPEGTSVIYLPFDFVSVFRRCFKIIRPQLFIVIETELWPNLFKAAAERNLPVIILNGRISGRSSKGYQRISFFMRKVFDNVTLFCMQSRADAERIKAIGAEPGKVMVTGNFKFDMNMPLQTPDWLRHIQGPVIVAGSTHAGEEQIIIDAYRENVYLFPGLRLILAPRHPERFKEAEDIIVKSDIRYIKRSEFGEDPGLMKLNIILLDTVGDLASVYSIADIAIVGKSFTGSGGQNPLEPAFWGRPIICGPHMENFPFVKEFYAEGAAFEVTSAGLAKKIKELLMQPEKAKAAGEKALILYRKNSGAVDRALKIIDGFISDKEK